MATINATIREGSGKEAARKLRRAAKVPAVVYGNNENTMSLTLDLREFTRLMESEKGALKTKQQNLLLESGERLMVLVRDIQKHAVTQVPMHVDFYRINPEHEIEVHVPIHVVNQEQSPGVKRGGLAQVVTKEIVLFGKAKDMPTSLDVSIAGLEIGDSVHLSQVQLPEGVKPHHIEQTTTLVVISGIHVDTTP